MSSVSPPSRPSPRGHHDLDIPSRSSNSNNKHARKHPLVAAEEHSAEREVHLQQQQQQQQPQQQPEREEGQEEEEAFELGESDDDDDDEEGEEEDEQDGCNNHHPLESLGGFRVPSSSRHSSGTLTSSSKASLANLKALPDLAGEGNKISNPNNNSKDHPNNSTDNSPNNNSNSNSNKKNVQSSSRKRAHPVRSKVKNTAVLNSAREESPEAIADKHERLRVVQIKKLVQRALFDRHNRSRNMLASCEIPQGVFPIKPEFIPGTGMRFSPSSFFHSQQQKQAP